MNWEALGNIMDNMKIGCLLCAYNMAEYVDDCLSPWIFAKDDKLGGNEFVISAVSASFAEYKDAGIKEDNTKERLRWHYNQGNIDYLSDNLEWVSEKEARNAALKPLLQVGCDLIIMVDLDEVYSIQDIENIFNYVTLEKWISSFSVCLKNFVFDDKTHLLEPFCPNRIWRVNTNGYKLRECIYDNNMSYEGDVVYNAHFEHRVIGEKDLPHKVIPQRVAFVKHLTWMNNEKSRLKRDYQIKRWGVCSYKWDDTNGLSFDEEYYKKLGQKVPAVMKINT